MSVTSLAADGNVHRLWRSAELADVSRLIACVVDIFCGPGRVWEQDALGTITRSWPMSREAHR
jgi:hypothetical protein